MDSQFLCVEDFEKHFIEKADGKALGFIQTGCEREETLEENKIAFHKYKLCPRFLRSLTPCDLRTEILGKVVTSPVGAAPMGLNKLAHLDGENALAKACAESGQLYTLSVNSSTSLEDVARATRGSTTPRWFQIYILKDRRMTLELIRRAEQSGYSALVVTVDNIFKGLRYKAQRDPVIFDSVIRRANYDSLSKDNKMVFGQHYSMYDQGLSWETIDWLREVTDLPLILKGIQTGEDAVLALEHGVAAVWVSNHGGRQLDSVRPTLEVLPEVCLAVAGGCEVYLDSGVRSGNDVLKALALGAKAVFLGRPLLWGLFQGGEAGVTNVLNIIRNELESVMMLSGCCKISDITPKLLAKSCNCKS